MSTSEVLEKELAVIPVPARIIAGFAYVLFGAGMFFLLTRQPNDPPWPIVAKAIFSALVPIALTVWILAVGYVNGDARRRGMRHVLWTLLAIFVPNLIGILLYFLLRDPMPAYCSHCGARVRPGFTHCPHCGSRLAASCPQCVRPVESGWSNCAYCGAKL